MNIVVFGFKSCGKGFIGKGLAEISEMPLVETDDMVEEIYLEKSGERLSYREIAKKHGMPFFRRLEEEAVKKASSFDGTIIATGGGTMLFQGNIDALRKNGKLVLLKLGKEELFKSIMASGIPVFFDSTDPKGSFERLFRERMVKFEKEADFEIKYSEATEQTVPKQILRLVAKP